MRASQLAVPCAVLSLLAMAALKGTSAQTTRGLGQGNTVARVRSQAPMPTPRVLARGETIPFPLPAPTMLSGWVHADQAGNIYIICGSPRFHSGPLPNVPPNGQLLPITMLSPDSKSATEYPLPTTVDGRDTYWRIDFNVDPYGVLQVLYNVQVSALTEEKQPWEYVVLKMEKDGTVDSTIRLDNPPPGPLTIYHFAVFGDGSFLVTGILNQPWPGLAKAGRTLPSQRPFTGIFDRQGRFMQELTLPDDVSPPAPGPQNSELPAPNEAPQTTAGPRWMYALNFSLMVAGPEDTIYLLRAASPPLLYTLSSDGEVVHQARIDWPSRPAVVTQMSAAGRADLMIDFYTSTIDREGNAHSTQTYALVDPASGEVLAAYRLPARTYPFFAGATGPQDLEFIGSTADGKLAVIKYSGR